jgi:hypothetical protein
MELQNWPETQNMPAVSKNRSQTLKNITEQSLEAHRSLLKLAGEKPTTDKT